MSGPEAAWEATFPEARSSIRAFADDGCLKVPSVLDRETCRRAAQWLDGASSGAGTRQALSFPWMTPIVQAVRRHPSIAVLLPPGAVAVQCTLFRKSIGHNWLVAMHQDLSIPVRDHVAAGGLRGWSKKEGAWFVQAPQDVLEAMVAVRLHLDDCGPADGPLRVIAGSHRQGIIPRALPLGDYGAMRECIAVTGDAWVMRPLLLHASSRASGSSARRVLHLLFGPPELPLGLRWRETV